MEKVRNRRGNREDRQDFAAYGIMLVNGGRGDLYPRGPPEYTGSPRRNPGNPHPGTRSKAPGNAYLCRKTSMHFLSRDLETYIADSSEAEPTLLAELSRETHLKVLRPRMITGHHQGRVLSLISRILRPESILEIGTYTGYSALCLAEGLSPGGELHTIDPNPELQDIQERFFNRSPYGDRIVVHRAPALEVIPGLDRIFDLVFIDADKSEYPAYLEAVLPKTRKGGLILLDNVLWSGKVVLGEDKKDPVTGILQKLNRDLPRDPRLRTVMLPIRDGITVCEVL